MSEQGNTEEGGKKRVAETLDIYDILVNDADEILVAIDARDSEPDSPRVRVRDGGLLLVRHREEALYMADVPEHLIDKVLALDEVLVAETDESGIVRDYTASVKK